MVLQGNARVGRHRRDAVCVHRLISDTLSRKTRVRNEVASEASVQHGAGIGCEISAADRGGAPQIHPAHSDYCVNMKHVTVWEAASFLATGGVIENEGAMTEDASMLRPVHEARHINLEELDAVL